MIYHVFQIFSIRMAAVIMTSLGTIWYRTKVMYRAWAVITCGLSLVLIVPAWVFTVSIGTHHRTQPASHAQGSSMRRI